MTMPLHPSLLEATRLTRAGRLEEATDLIRAMLAGGAPAEPTPAMRDSAILDLTPEGATVSPSARRSLWPDKPLWLDKEGPAVEARTGGTFLTRSYHGPAGTLGYKLYVPPSVRDGMPLVVMLHGCSQSPDDFALGTGMNRLADELGFLVAYPAQTQAANASRCWNWFKSGDQQRGRGEPALIAGITRQVIADYRIDRQRVYIAGLSAGGAEAAIMGAAYPDLYAAVGIHSGLACGAARDLPTAMMAMRQGSGINAAGQPGTHFVPTITFHGDQDTTVHEVNSCEIVARAAAAAGPSLRTHSEAGRSPGGRAYTRAVSVDDRGRALIEQWTIHGGGHAWSGGSRSGSFTDPSGPDASREMLRFFLAHRATG
ncbi:esterase [Sphingomonas oleivorans]|uniref:Esterase n=1 Tax=Sphingomonas oleivorans TaxID=1735121 RepID=A0A2T5G0A6_9SPHN|nr:PHB depolymerase family esterase [Sphingomonas oleivorans]PTQ12385.1 esterase [Sphingomonas oleivorans]